MLKLSSNSVIALGEVTEPAAGIRRLADDSTSPLQTDDYMIVSGGSSYFPRGYAGYLFFEKPAGQVPQNSFLLEHGLSYLQAGDIIKIKPERNSVRVLYRKNSPHNALLLTERCDNFCLMCSQPPKDIDDSYLAEEVLRTIPLMSPETKEITLTGGEPTLLGESLIQIIQSLKRHLPATAVHILSNGRSFKQWEYAKAIADIGHNDLMIGIPLYSDVPWLHNHVVQAEHAFDDTIRGILNLKSVGVKVEIRIVVHRLTFARLPDLARFIRRNLTFCDHVALMGLEITGFTKINLDKLWIDPVDYQSQLREAVELLARARIPVSIYNHQLCLLDPSLYPFSRKSISDWKNEYLPECEGCMRKGECGGFFSSASLRHSAHIDPFQY